MTDVITGAGEDALTRPDGAAYRGAHVLSLRQYTRRDLERLFDRADAFAAAGRRELGGRLTGRVMVTAFFQRSTRTRLAHESAMLRLGGRVTGFADPEVTRARDFARESAEDVVRMLSGYGDVIVLRHGERGAAALAAASSSVPVINAGDGTGEHPTQAMADLYAMRRRFGRLDGLRVLVVGDLRMRTANSLLLALRLFGCRIRYAAPPALRPDPGLLAELAAAGTAPVPVSGMREALRDTDVLYLQPVVQPDTVPDPSAPPPTPPEFRVTRRLLHEHGHDGLLVLHPLPRHDELDRDVDDTVHNGYWPAAAGGVTVRMALLDLVLGA